MATMIILSLLTVVMAWRKLRGVDVSSLSSLTKPLWSVSDLTLYLRQSLESDYRLQDLWVAGEASNVSRPASGHLYFTLRDTSASLRCVMWRSQVAHQVYLPQDGEALEAHGHISIYEAGGQYQLYVDVLRPAGEGLLFQEFLRLKALLDAEGLFDPSLKRPLPVWPLRIGVVTSPTGAAWQDVLQVLRRRFPLGEVILVGTQVQGEEAPQGIVSGLEALNRFARPDVILLVRGGGSIEDLWAFNQEEVVRAVSASDVPVITGIGHETDVVLADFAADVRAPTPSAAAEMATPSRERLKEDLIESNRALFQGMSETLRNFRAEFKSIQSALRLTSPRARVANARQRVDEWFHRSMSAVEHSVALRRADLAGHIQTLRAVGPAEVLARGYAVVTRISDRELIRSVRSVAKGDELEVRVQDGGFGVKVNPGLDSEQGE